MTSSQRLEKFKRRGPSPSFIATVDRARALMARGYPVGAAIVRARREITCESGYPADYQAVYRHLIGI